MIHRTARTRQATLEAFVSKPCPFNQLTHTSSRQLKEENRGRTTAMRQAPMKDDPRYPAGSVIYSHQLHLSARR